MNDAQIETIADRVLRPALGPFGYERAEVRTGYDYSDEPAIYIHAVFAEGAPEMGEGVFLNAHAALGRALLDEGEERFPYLRTRHLGDELPEDVEFASSRSDS